MLDNFACAYASSKILLQGMLYLTNQACYFYSPFNAKTLVGRGSKIQVPYTELASIKKENTVLVFPNAIRFIFKSGDQLLFQSFISRDTCFSFILSLMTQQGLLEQTRQSQLQSSTRAEKLMTSVKDYYVSRKVTSLKEGTASSKVLTSNPSIEQKPQPADK